LRSGGRERRFVVATPRVRRRSGSRMSGCGRFCCRSILRAVARNIDSSQRAAVQLRFVEPAILILSLRQSRPPTTFATWGNETAALQGADRIGSGILVGGAPMEYFAGLDISMKETHICVVKRDGKVVYEAKAVTSPAASRPSWLKRRQRSVLSLRRGAWR